MAMVHNAEWAAWLNSAVNVLIANNVKVVFDHGLKYSHFEEDPLELVVNCSADKWHLTFIHEYHHFCQWKEESDNWPEDDIYTPILDDPSNADRAHIEMAVACEKECEEWSLKAIQKLFPKDAPQYCRAANAYLAFWNVIDKLGAWYKIPPYVVPEVVSVMPFDRIVVVESESLTELIRTHCL